MANVRKKISELTALTSASLDTVIVGVDNGTTYKIELDVLADAVTNRINTLDIQRLNSLESVTSSFETKGRSLISSSAQITNLGFISTSVDISSLNTFTSSQQTLNTAFTNGISSRLTTSSFESFSSSVHSEILAATNEQSFNGLISGSSQLTSSYDERYVISGSITQTNWDNISGKPSGLVSQSTDLTSLNSKTGSYATTGSNTFVGNQKITGSVSILIPGGTAYAMNENPTPNNEFWAYVVQYPDAQNVAVGWTAAIVGGSTYTVTAVNYQHPFNKITLSDGSLQMGYRIGINFSKSSKLWEFNSNGTLTGLPDGLISGSSQLTSSFDSRYLVTGSITSSINQLNTFTASVSTASLVDRLDTIESATSSYETKGSGILSGSVSYLDLTNIPSGIVSQSTDLSQLNSFTQSIDSRVDSLESSTSSYLTTLDGAISSSSQLTSSFDTRYTLSGSVQPLPSGLISGSSQLTSSYDSRYSLSGSSTSRVFASDTAPSSPTQGDLWWKTDDGNLYVYYDSYWIVATDTISALPSGLISGSAQVTPAWTSAGAVTIGGTTTAPTKGTRTQDNISYRQLGAKQWEVVMTYFQTANTGAANGSGDYLFTLPNSLSFDMTIPSQTQYQSNIGTSSWYNATYVIPSGNGMISNGATGGKVFPVVYNSTQFRILAINDSAWVKWAGSGHFQLADNPYVTIQLTFRFTSA